MIITVIGPRSHHWHHCSPSPISSSFSYLFSWTHSGSHRNNPPFVDAHGDLVIDVDVSTNWTGEYLCLYACGNANVTLKRDRNISDGNISVDAAGWKRRIIWLTVYERDADLSRHLKALFILDGVVAFVCLVCAILINMDEIRFSIWRRFNFGGDERFTYVGRELM